MSSVIVCGDIGAVDPEKFRALGLSVSEIGRYFVAVRPSGSIQVFETDDVLVAVSGVVYLPPDRDYGFNQQAAYLHDEFCARGHQGAAAIFGHYFACALDKKEQALYCFGDPMGGRRVFFKQTDAGAVCASKLKVFKDAGLSEGKANVPYRGFALVYGYYPKTETIYADVKRAEKTEIAAFGRHDRPFAFMKRPTPPAFVRAKDELERGQVISELHDRLIRVVEASLRGVDSVAVMLGGFDSALVAALAVRAGKKVKAYTFQYADAGFNQKNVDSVVDALGIEHTWVEVNARTIEKGLAEFSDCFDRPTNWPNYVIQTKLLCEVAKQDGAQVGLTGDGCDEIFLGYPGIYRGAKFFGGERQLPGWFVESSKLLIGRKFLEKRLGHVHRLVLRVISNMGMEQRARLYLIFRIMDETTISHLYGLPSRELATQIRDVIDQVVSEMPDLPPTILAYEGRDHIVPNRMKLTGAMDATGLPLFSPYLHPDVRSYVRSLPESMLRPGGEAKRTTLGKDILLEMADSKGLLPHNVIYQPKHAAVDGPLDRWYEQEISATLTRLISSVEEVADADFLKALIREKPIDVFYRQNYSVDNITCHAASMLATSGAFFAPKAEAALPLR